MKTENIMFRTDSYKLNHWNQYPAGTQYVNSYFESRQGAKFEKTMLLLLQVILEKIAGVVVTQEKIDQAAEMAKYHFGNDKYFNRAGWEYILKKHGGRLPLRIKAVPEGMPVPVSNVLMTVENTDPKCYWLTNYVESLLTHVWYPSTVGTLSHETKAMIKRYLEETSDNLGGLNFMLHDFGYRGVSSDESAEMGGAAHLINFLGTDTVPAIQLLKDYYNAEYKDIAYSVAATEHSVMTALGREGERDVLESLLANYPTGILSVVADSFDIYNFVENFVCNLFKDDILKRDGVFVVRPDSVSPLHPTPEKQVVWIAQTLANGLGYTVNSKGYMVINPKVRILWGDGIEMNGIEKILAALKDAGFSAENMATFGMGGGLLQKVNRDTQRFAFKSSAQCRNGNWYDVYKEPKDLSKASKRGRLKLVWQEGAHGKTMVTVREDDPRPDIMRTVFEDGEIKVRYTLAEVRENAKL